MLAILARFKFLQRPTQKEIHEGHKNTKNVVAEENKTMNCSHYTPKNNINES